MLAGISMRTRAVGLVDLPTNRLLAALLLVAALLSSAGLAQENGGAPAADGAAPPGAETPLPEGPVVGLTGDDPEALSDRAVAAWLDQQGTTIADLTGADTEALCRELPGMFAAPAPPAGTEVDLDDRRARDTGSEDRLRYTYAAELPGDRLDVVEAVLVRDGDAWRVDRVGFQIEGTTGRTWLQTGMAAGAFGLFTLLVILGLARPTPLRRWVAAGLAAVREHRRLVAWTMGLGWAVIALGLWTGSQLPATCEEAVLVVLGNTLEQVGATQAVASGNIARAAVVIFYQNYVVVTVTLLFGAALLLGVPAYLLAGASFLAQSTAFGLLGLGGFPEIVMILVLFVLEFTSYFLVVAGGGMLVASLARNGLSGLGDGYRKLALMLPLAGLLLLVGAWYEAVVVVGF